MPSQQEEAQRELKVRLHQIPHPTDRALLRRAIKKVVTSLTQAHKVEMGKMMEEILEAKFTQVGSVNAWVTTDEIEAIAKKFNIEVK